MADAPPPAAGVRIDWAELPDRIRAGIEARFGSSVVEAVTQPGGFSPGAAVRLRMVDGRRAFVKAVAATANPLAPRFHRREARIVAALPVTAPVPRLLWSWDERDLGTEGGDGWVVLAFEDVDGRQPIVPWRADELDRALDALASLSAALTPSPVPPEATGPIAEWFASAGQGWRLARADPPAGLDPWSARHLDALAALEARAGEASAGETLLHSDLRADNLLLTADRVFVVDWPHARVGAAWIDAIFFAPSVAMQGGPRPDYVLARHPAARRADDDAVAAVVAAVAGFFTWQSLQPPPPGLPTVRAFQAAQGIVAREWLAERTGLR